MIRIDMSVNFDTAMDYTLQKCNLCPSKEISDLALGKVTKIVALKANPSHKKV